MHPALRLAGAAGVTAVPLALLSTAAQADPADQADGSYSARLDQQNGSGASGMVTVGIDGDRATVNLSCAGLAEELDGGPFPHVRHVHIGGQGVCPGPWSSPP